MYIYRNICRVKELVVVDGRKTWVDATDEITKEVPFLKTETYDIWEKAWVNYFADLAVIFMKQSTVSWDVEEVALDNDLVRIRFSIGERQFVMTYEGEASDDGRA